MVICFNYQLSQGADQMTNSSSKPKITTEGSGLTHGHGKMLFSFYHNATKSKKLLTLSDQSWWGSTTVKTYDCMYVQYVLDRNRSPSAFSAFRLCRRCGLCAFTYCIRWRGGRKWCFTMSERNMRPTLPQKGTYHFVKWVYLLMSRA